MERGGATTGGDWKVSGDRNRTSAIRHLLAQLGADDFALLRKAPPLLYHNDLSASVKRFYWSEDAGYALWLRLYEAITIVNP